MADFDGLVKKMTLAVLQGPSVRIAPKQPAAQPAKKTAARGGRLQNACSS